MVLRAAADGDGLAHFEAAPLHPANADAAHIVVVIDVGEQHLGGALQVPLGAGDLVDDHLKQRRHVRAGGVGVQGGVAVPGGGVAHGELQLVVVGAQLDEQVQHLVHHFRGAGPGPVDFIQHHHWLLAQGQGLFQHKAGLGHAALKGVHQQQHAVHHLQHALHLAAEIGVAGGIHNVDFNIAILYGGVFRQDGDAPLPLQVAGVHHPLGHGLVGAKHAALPQQLVHQGGLAVVYVGNDGHVAQVFSLCHIDAIPFYTQVRKAPSPRESRPWPSAKGSCFQTLHSFHEPIYYTTKPPA